MSIEFLLNTAKQLQKLERQHQYEQEQILKQKKTQNGLCHHMVK